MKEESKSKSHYAMYVEERLGKNVLESENGFAQYSFGPDYLFIEEIYVVPELRQKDIASEMADELAVLALENGKPYLLGTVSVEAEDATKSLKVLLGYGFELKDIDRDSGLIIFIKKIQEDKI